MNFPKIIGGFEYQSDLKKEGNLFFLIESRENEGASRKKALNFERINIFINKAILLDTDKKYRKISNIIKTI